MIAFGSLKVQIDILDFVALHCEQSIYITSDTCLNMNFDRKLVKDGAKQMELPEDWPWSVNHPSTSVISN